MRHHVRLPQLLAVVLLAAAGIGGATLAGATQSASGLTQTVNQLSTVPSGGSLTAVTCLSAGSCVAVGNDLNGLPISLHGNPAAWTGAQARQVPLGAAYGNYGYVQSLACVTAAECVTLGTDRSNKLFELRGNPASWGAAQARHITLGATFGAYTSLLSISCSSYTSCVAVGGDAHGQPMVLSGDPATWGGAQGREITLGSGFGGSGSLSSVTCTSSTQCTAVGSDAHAEPFVLNGNPATWNAAQAVEIALGSGFGFGGALATISCTSSTQCTAGGSDHKSMPFVLNGNPAAWSAAQANEIVVGAAFGSTGWITTLSCATASQCTAVGNDAKNEPLLLSGNPATWTGAQARLLTLSATYGGGGTAAAIDCSSGAQCTIVGYGTNHTLLALNGNPAGWTNGSFHPIILKGAGFGVVAKLSALSCPSPTTCVAVGRDLVGNPLVIDGNPAKWASAKAINIPLGASLGEGGSFISVACNSPTSCTAVGFDSKFQPLVIHGNPDTWGTSSARQLTLSAKFGKGGSLSSVACPTPTLCLAAGTDNIGQLLLLRGNPANWGPADLKGLSLPAKLGFSGQLHAIWCMTVTLCETVGSDGHGEPIDLVGNEATWTAAKVHEIALSAAFGKGGSLASIDCTSATMCVADGTDNKGEALVLRGNPAGWSTGQAFHVRITNPPNTVQGFSGYGKSAMGFLTDVSCLSATDCLAVGLDYSDAPLYLQGNPATWKTAATIRPPVTATFAEGSFDASFCGFGMCHVLGVSSGKVTGDRPAFLAHN